jgi:hypothetical protein
VNIHIYFPTGKDRFMNFSAQILSTHLLYGLVSFLHLVIANGFAHAARGLNAHSIVQLGDVSMMT